MFDAGVSLPPARMGREKPGDNTRRKRS